MTFLIEGNVDIGIGEGNLVESLGQGWTSAE